MRLYSLSFLFLAIMMIFSCKKETALLPEPMPDGTDITPQFDQNPSSTGCNDTLTPIVMVHGFLASGDTWASQAMRFTSNGYCPERIFAFDWNTLGGGGTTAALDQFIDDVLTKTGASRVHLVGHSAGGGQGYTYLNDAARAAKVWKYVHIGSGAQSGPAGPGGSTPTLNIYSTGDEVVQGADIPGATNVQLTDLDHYEVATGTAPFAAMYEFFNNGQQPQTTDILPEYIPCLAGRVVTFGENQPKSGATVRIYEIDATTGQRVSNTPQFEQVIDGSGNWGPVPVLPTAYFEFEVTPPGSTERRVYYYREPAKRTNFMIYLRVLPPPTSLAGILLASLPSDDNQSVVAVFSSSQAVISGRDQLTANGYNLATPQYASADQTTIAFFLYDDGDSQTSGNPVGLFGQFSFLNGVDVFFPTTPPAPISIVFNNRTLNIPNRKSASEGLLVPVFD